MIFSSGDIFRSSIDANEFNILALEAFSYQSCNNPVYKEYLSFRNYSGKPAHFTEIPFLPIELFKSHRIQTGVQNEHEIIFSSSGTTGAQTSKHFVANADTYVQSFTKCFELFFGSANKFHFLALLPSYLERTGSSLIYMVDHLMKASGKGDFFLHDHEALDAKLSQLESEGQQSILFGVSYALMDFAERFPRKLRHCKIIETGGMKGTRKEITKAELHSILTHSFGADNIASEYGMTELLSQAYSISSLSYQTAPWLKALVRDPYDPFAVSTEGKGALNFIDLANIDSCCFIETHDLGSITKNTFEIAGRMDNAQIRGCNLLVQ